MEFDFYDGLELEEINTLLEIQSKDVTKDPKRKVRRMEYCIRGQVNQGNRKIATGRGLAFGKERIQSM
jgi:ribosomal protein L13E